MKIVKNVEKYYVVVGSYHFSISHCFFTRTEAIYDKEKNPDFNTLRSRQHTENIEIWGKENLSGRNFSNYCLLLKDRFSLNMPINGITRQLFQLVYSCSSHLYRFTRKMCLSKWHILSKKILVHVPSETIRRKTSIISHIRTEILPFSFLFTPFKYIILCVWIKHEKKGSQRHVEGGGRGCENETLIFFSLLFFL